MPVGSPGNGNPQGARSRRYRLAFTSAALEQLERIAACHLRRVGPASAEKVTDRLLEAFLILEEQPLAGQEHPDDLLRRQGFRRLVCYDYVGICRTQGDTVLVYGVYHGAQNYPELFE